MAALRQDLVRSAVDFLRDPTIASSPLAKRLQFLESKGLTPAETDDALRRASDPSAQPPGGAWGSGSYGRGPLPPNGRYGRPEEVARDWRDWFVMTVIGGGVGMLMISLARKYLFPALQPPDRTELEAAQAALTTKYDEAAAILAMIQSETRELREEFDNQGKLVEQTVHEVKEAMEECVKGEEKREEEMDKIRDEVESLKDTLPRMLEKHKDAQTQSLNDLQNELKSLKSLLGPRVSSNAAPSSSSPPAPAVTGAAPRAPGARYPSATGSTALPGLGSRPPGIPAWQLAATQSSTAGSSTAGITGPQTTSSAYRTTPTGSPPSKAQELPGLIVGGEKFAVSEPAAGKSATHGADEVDTKFDSALDETEGVHPAGATVRG